MNQNLHPEILRAVENHKAFYRGEKSFLVKIYMPDLSKNEHLQEYLLPEIPYDGLDWDNQFEEYYSSRVNNARICAGFRLDMGIGDDYIPIYHPFFGIAIHHAFFGGNVSFGSGSSYCHEVISEAAEFPKLHYDLNNIWMRRLAEGMDYCRENGGGVLIASLRGGNGPLDMANGIMGNNLFTEVLEDEENMEKVMEICTDACDAMYQFQKEHASFVEGGYLSALGDMWMPKEWFGHIASDASLLTGPALYDKFEKPMIEKLAGKYKGFVMHIHMMGWKMFGSYAETGGVNILRPQNDPKYPTICEKLPEVLAMTEGKAILEIDLPSGLSEEELGKTVSLCKGRQVIFETYARTKEEAIRRLDRISTILS